MSVDEIKDKLSGYETLRKREKYIKRRIDEIKRESSSANTEKIVEKLERQKEAAEQKMMQIIEVLEMLGDDSRGRNILELRYIDLRTWTEIERMESMSRSVCFTEREKAIKELSQCKKAVKILEKI